MRHKSGVGVPGGDGEDRLSQKARCGRGRRRLLSQGSPVWVQVEQRGTSALRDKGYAVWLDDWEILVGHNTVEEVFRGIVESEFLAVLLSPESCRSKWVQEELTTARINEIERRKVVVLPVLLKPCDIPGPLWNKRYADFTSSPG